MESVPTIFRKPSKRKANTTADWRMGLRLKERSIGAE